MANSVWTDVLARIETKVNKFSYYTWFRQTSLASDDGDSLTILINDPMVEDWLTRHYTVILEEALTEVGRPGVRLKFKPADGRAPSAPMRAEPPPPADPETQAEAEDEGAEGVVDGADLGGLSPRYSFET